MSIYRVHKHFDSDDQQKYAKERHLILKKRTKLPKNSHTIERHNSQFIVNVPKKNKWVMRPDVIYFLDELNKANTVEAVIEVILSALNVEALSSFLPKLISDVIQLCEESNVLEDTFPLIDECFTKQPAFAFEEENFKISSRLRLFRQLEESSVAY